jgi:hypothetical protein
VFLGRKLLTTLLLIGLLGLPAVLLRFMCVGRSCDEEASATSRIPFCSLEQGLRSRLESGFREGRSPDVVAVARASIAGGGGDSAGSSPPWPSGNLDGVRVPLVFAGGGVRPTEIPPGTTLTSIAPTLAKLIDFERPFPGVRSGKPIGGVAEGSDSSLLLQVILKGIGSDDLEKRPEAWPFLGSLMNEGAATMHGDAGSLPLDPAAIISTIGTGGTPDEHGITGELVRNEAGRLVSAFAAAADSPVIATLGDDLDEALDQKPLIGLVGETSSDVGAIGGDWYVEGDRDSVVLAPRDRVRATTAMLAQGFGDNSVPDLLTVVMEGDIAALDRDLERVAAAANRAARGSVSMAVTATGAMEPDAQISGDEISRNIDEAVGLPVVEAAVPGGLFLDQRTLSENELSDDALIDELERMQGPDGRVFDDVFPSIAISFARFC